MNIKKKINKENLIFFLLLIIFITSNNFFLNLNYIKKNTYNDRLYNIYGQDCEKYSYGFIDNILKNNKSIQVKIINKYNLPPVKNLFNSNRFINSSDNLIVLNYNKNYILKNFPEHSIKKQSKNCYFLVK